MNRKQQEAKKYLSQAFGLNQRIESKLNQRFPRAFFMPEGGGSIAEKTETAMFLAGMSEPDGGKVL